MRIYGLAGLLATIVVWASIGLAGAEPVSFVVLGDAPIGRNSAPISTG
jgi:hypothetical protein